MKIKLNTEQRKSVFILSLIFISFITTSQTCLNPSYKLNKLKSKGLTKDTIYNWVQKDLSFIQLTSHDTIADIGSYNGYYPLLYSVSTDSIVFYLNDIVNTGFIYFDSIYTLCTKIRGSKITNEFKIVMGENDSTNLPSITFNKIILRDALHHFKSPVSMLTDIKRIIKPNGKLILFESIKNSQVPNATLCKGSMTKDELVKLLGENGFTLTRQKFTENDRFWFEFKLSKVKNFKTVINK
jgi:SAM-dependent methyltransferase